MIDEDHLARQTAGDTDLQHELLTLFLTQLEIVRDELNADAARGRPIPADLPLILHRIRGAAAAVGAHGLARSFGFAEAELERNPASQTVLGPLQDAVTAACDAIENLIAARGRPGLAKNGESR